VRRFVSLFVAVAALAALLAVGGTAAPAGAGASGIPYTCTVEDDIVDPISTELFFTLGADLGPLAPTQPPSYLYGLELPELDPPINININSLTVHFPVPIDASGVGVQLDTQGSNPPAAFWTTGSTAQTLTATYTGSGFNKIQARTAANGGGAIFPIGSENLVVVPEAEVVLVPGTDLANSTLDINPPAITGEVDVFGPLDIECLPDNPDQVIASTDVCGTQQFSDVPTSAPFYCDIDWMVQEEITTGFPGGLFKPADAVKRQSMSAFMYRLAGSPMFPLPDDPTFSDVPETHPFYDEIEWMNFEEITTGFSGGVFKPNDTVKRQSMSAFMYRFAEEPMFTPPGSPSFNDVPTTHPFYDEVEWMAEEGITTGFPGGLFKPSADVTRQSMSAFMHRLDTLLDGPF
jgi:hypothetical protein